MESKPSNLSTSEIYKILTGSVLPRPIAWVSSIDPGLVETEFSEVRFDGDTERAETVYQGYTPLKPEDVADAVCYVANTPDHVNILELLILPTDQRNAFVINKEG